MSDVPEWFIVTTHDDIELVHLVRRSGTTGFHIYVTGEPAFIQIICNKLNGV